MKDNGLRFFVVEVHNFDGEEIGSMTLDGLSKHNTFVDVLCHAYNECSYPSAQKRHQKEDEDFEVTVYKVDSIGRKYCIGEMDVRIEGDATFEEIIELAYHGCTDD